VRHLCERRLRHRAPRRRHHLRHRPVRPIACAGPLLAAEIDAITKALAHPKRPLVAIVAGSKVSTKLTILKSLAANVDQLIVGGGIANTFMLAAGLKIGKSLAEPDLVDEAKAVIEAMKARGAEVPIPTDVVTAKEFGRRESQIKAATDVADDDLILDIGPETAKRLAAQLMKAGTIVWNGPVGVFEFAAFENGTKVIAQAIAESPPSALPAAATRWRRLPNTASKRTWATSPPAAGPSWRCWRARRCRRWRFSRSARRAEALAQGGSHDPATSVFVAVYDHLTLGLDRNFIKRCKKGRLAPFFPSLVSRPDILAAPRHGGDRAAHPAGSDDRLRGCQTRSARLPWENRRPPTRKCPSCHIAPPRSLPPSAPRRAIPRCWRP
jgi:hypothetical protein